MKATELKANQRELKIRYSETPQTAMKTLMACGQVDFENLAFSIESPAFLSPAGLHPLSGGDGSFACSVEILLASWAGCAGVTLAAVAHSMKLKILGCRIVATGELDFRGTLAVEKTAPVGLQTLRLHFDLATDESDDAVNKLIGLTEKYCVVHQSLMNRPDVQTSYVTHSRED